MSRNIVVALVIALALGYLLLKGRGAVSSSDARGLVEAAFSTRTLSAGNGSHP